MNLGTFEISTNTFSINTEEDLRKAKEKFDRDQFFKKYFEKIKI